MEKRKEKIIQFSNAVHQLIESSKEIFSTKEISESLICEAIYNFLSHERNTLINQTIMRVALEEAISSYSRNIEKQLSNE